MLVLSRKQNESIFIDGRITVTVSEIRGGRVRLAVEAPREVRIERTEKLLQGDVRTVSHAQPRNDDSHQFVIAAG
jgi:carbon storage regulator